MRRKTEKKHKDALTKAYVKNARVFADAFNYLLYDGQPVLQPERLHELDTTAISVPYGAQDAYTVDQRHRDVLKCLSAKTDDTAAYLLLGMELQDSVHYAIPVRNMLYDAQQYEKQVAEASRSHERERKRTKSNAENPETAVANEESAIEVKSTAETEPGAETESAIGAKSTARTKPAPESNMARKPNSGEFLSGFWKDDKLLPVITLVIHFNAETWDGPLSLHDMLSVQDAHILSYVSDYKVNLLSPACMTDEEISKLDTDLREVLLYIKYSDDKDKLAELFRERERFGKMSREAVYLVNEVTGSEIPFDENEEVIDMCKAIDDMRKESMEIGEARGEARGVKLGEARGEKKGTDRVNQLNRVLLEEKRIEDLERAVRDDSYQKKLMKEYKLI